MKSSEKQELKLKLKRVGLFLLIVLLPVLFICVGLQYADIPQWLNIFVLVIVMFVFFFIFCAICAKLDKKKHERMSKKKDPFSD